MKTYTAVIERDAEAGLYVGYVPGLLGAHTQAETLNELQQNLCEVVELVLEDPGAVHEDQFVGTQQIVIFGGAVDALATRQA